MMVKHPTFFQIKHTITKIQSRKELRNNAFKAHHFINKEIKAQIG